MGFNLQSATASEVLEEEAPEWMALIRKELGQSVPLGTPGNHYFHADEIGWSWWKSLQEHAARELADPKNLLAVDAWFGAYLDGPIDPTILRPQPASQQPKELVALPALGFVDRLRSLIGLAPKNVSTDDLERRALNDMQPSNCSIGALHPIIKMCEVLRAGHSVVCFKGLWHRRKPCAGSLSQSP